MKTNYFTLITGASQGFGKALAIECAKREMNLFLIDLPGTGLNNLQEFLKQNFGIKVYSFSIDLSSTEDCKELVKFIHHQKIELKYLINNAGVLSKGFFHEVDLKYYLKQIEVNICAPTLLIKLFYDQLKRNAPSGILNVSSMASYFSLPTKQVYGATKAYLYSLSRSLNLEFKSEDIWVSIVCPGGMNTNPYMCYKNRTMGWFAKLSIMDPEEVAAITMDAFLERKEVIIPGTVNKFYLALGKLIPQSVRDSITTKEMNRFRAAGLSVG
ncbi:SDR family NAD(P)-dependent oxidoreductase [Christiangramia crocea]|uniref:SDR family NAD(P)-dependent oxidoreductase n=1 Tax=Christiangramia crocea TaxID=2904124 RepID=A0A9X2A611_9FLAO|nr:SDR family NAD(P)-dependent oxidoreductase [Gramella crocea]MCG9971700.1 SDR family NAD(P)-dependent oxidoreductase [Gramella crocea]